MWAVVLVVTGARTTEKLLLAYYVMGFLVPIMKSTKHDTHNISRFLTKLS
jgi:hypothetical protein